MPLRTTRIPSADPLRRPVPVAKPTAAATDLAFRPVGSAPGSLAESAAETCAAYRGRPYQVELAREIVQAIEHPIGRSVLGAGQVISSALVVVPTGGGKTMLALSVAETLQRAVGLRVGLVAARRDLLRQVRAEIRAFGFRLDLRTISMFDADPPQVDLLVWDEAHRDACATAASLAAKVRPSYVLGLTATPWRTDRARLAYGHELRRCSIQSLQDDGHLAPYEHVSIDDWDPMTVARAWLANRERFGRSVLFFRTGAEANACLRALRAGGARADVVSGATDRETQIDEFACGGLDVVVAMGCLNEGFSAPWLRSVFVRPASKGPTVQMGGRVFRPHPDLPMKTIVQSRSAEVPFTRIARPAEQHLLSGATWRSIGATRDLSAIVDRMRGVLAGSRADLPDLISKSRGRRTSAAVRGFRTDHDPMQE